MAEKRGPDWDQRDVLKKKDNVTQGSRGLQIWGDDAMGDNGQAGNASQGTARRQAFITDAPGPEPDDKKGGETAEKP